MKIKNYITAAPLFTDMYLDLTYYYSLIIINLNIKHLECRAEKIRL